MIDTSREITTAAVEEWVSDLRAETEFGAEMRTIARTTLDAMAVSDTVYTGDDFYEILISSAARQEFVASEHGDAGVLTDTLGAADPAVLETLSRRVQGRGRVAAR